LKLKKKFLKLFENQSERNLGFYYSLLQKCQELLVLDVKNTLLLHDNLYEGTCMEMESRAHNSAHLFDYRYELDC
jgi:hypothetical protein